MSELKTEIIPYEITSCQHDNLAMSNVLISSKYRATVKELKITYLSMLKIQTGQYERKPDGLYVYMTGSEIKKELGIKGNGIYEQLVDIGESMTGKTIGIVDPDSKMFDFIAIITRARYENSKFMVRFANEIEDYIIKLEKNFTYLPKQLMMSFDKEYSFKLYEVLKSYAFYPRNYTGIKQGIFKINLNLAELKLTLGIVNSNLEEVKRVLKNGSNPDYEKAVDKSPEKMYASWSEFKRKILDKSIDEINKKTDIRVEYSPVTAGRGGKVVSIDFTICLKKYEQENATPVTLSKEKDILEPQLSDTDKFIFWTNVMTLFEKENLKIDEIQMISELSYYNMDTLKKVKEILDTQKNDIENVVGWIRTAIINNYELKPQKKESSNKKTKKNSFTNFPQRDYDYDELEKVLLTTTV